METKVLVQTMKTPTETTGSPSKGYGKRWGNFHPVRFAGSDWGGWLAWCPIPPASRCY